MPNIHDTAYPRLKRVPTPDELTTCYTPSPDEWAFAARLTNTHANKVCCLLALKTFQRLGYFVPLGDVPLEIVRHVAGIVGMTAFNTEILDRYDRSTTRQRHRVAIRTHLRIQPYTRVARRVMVRAMVEAAQTKQALADLVNVALEELVRQRYELPAFATLARAARRVRSAVTRSLYRQVAGHLSADTCVMLDSLFTIPPHATYTPWNDLKSDPGNPTLTHLKALVARLYQLQPWNQGASALVGIPDVKVKYWAAEARTLDAARMQALESTKRYTLAVAFLAMQSGQAHDDVAEMFIRRMQAIHQKARDALAAYHVTHQERTDTLISTFRDLLVAYRSEDEPAPRMVAIDTVLGDRSEQVLAACEAHLAYAGQNYYPFLWSCYTSHRATLFQMVRTLTFRSTSQDTSLEHAIGFLLQHEHSKRDWLPTVREEYDGKRFLRWRPLLDLSWIPDGWWRLLTNQWTRSPYPHRIHRRHFEVCVFSQMMQELKSGDLAVVGGDAYADYGTHLLPWDDYQAQVEEYGAFVGLPITGADFVGHFQRHLTGIAEQTDRGFPTNHAVRIERGEPVITRSKKRPEPEGLQTIETLLTTQLRPVSLLEVLTIVEQWLHWTRFFGPISGHEAKLEDTVSTYLATVFCYGCNLGPSQTARSLRTIDRRQLAWINLRHVTLETLELASREIINAYRRFALPQYWGSGKRVSADGTKWDIYERNLLAEYHIRYGGYGGIGYYHMTDTYIVSRPTYF